MLEAEAIREDVFHQLIHVFHMDVVDFEPIYRGWRNDKWNSPGAAQRFAEEMWWVAEHWDELGDLIQ